MIQLATDQLLQMALAVSAATMLAIALIFALVVYATKHRRARGWAYGWLAAAAALAFAAGAVRFTEAQSVLSLLSTIAGVACGAMLAGGAYRFAQDRGMPAKAWAAIAAGTLVALLAWMFTRFSSPLLGGEIGLMVGAAANAVALFPLARDRRRSGARASCIFSALIFLLMLRTAFSAAVLYAQGETFNDVYWILEVAGGTMFAWMLALSEVVATLDEVRLQLLETNATLERTLVDLEAAAKIDPLTGLHNRYAFYMLDEDFGELASRGGGCIAILDLNNLKKINDTFGHQAGDDALLSVARRLKETIRATDHVFRWGGDEFVVIMRGTTVEKARERFAHMPPPDAITAPRHPDPIELSVSWGVARMRKNVDAALREADASLYEQKDLVKRISGELKPS